MTEQLLQLDSRATAIFGCNDEIAAGALFVARKRELIVPQDLSIVGFENSPFSRQTWPGLTTVHQPNAEIAATAASMLIALGQKSQIQPQQLRRAEDRKAFDYIFLFEPFEAPLTRGQAS